MDEEWTIRVVPGRGNWVFVDWARFRGDIVVHVETDPLSGIDLTPGHYAEPTLRITDIHLAAHDGFLYAQILRDLPLGAIETLINSPSVRAELESGRDTHKLVARQDAGLSPGAKPCPGRGAFQTTLKTPVHTSAESRQRPRLNRPTGHRIDDDFLQQVADFYLDAVARGERPLVAIEREARVPRNTAARWVWRARNEGFLAPDTTRPKRTGMRRRSHDNSQSQP